MDPLGVLLPPRAFCCGGGEEFMGGGGHADAAAVARHHPQGEDNSAFTLTVRHSQLRRLQGTLHVHTLVRGRATRPPA